MADQKQQIGNECKGFAQNKKGICAADIGHRYKCAMLVIIATAQAGKTLVAADFADQINVMRNNRPQRTHTVDQLNQIQSKYGPDFQAKVYNYDTGVINYVNGLPQAAQAGKQTIAMIPVWFTQPWRATWAARDMFSWPTRWEDANGNIVAKLTQMSIEVLGTNNAVNVDYTQTYSCNVVWEYDEVAGHLDAKGVPVDFIEKFYQIPVPYGGAGLQPAIVLDKVDAYSEITFFCQAGDFINHIYVKVNGDIKRDVDKHVNDTYLLGRGFDPSQILRDRFDLVFDATDKVDDILQTNVGGQTVTELLVKPTLAAAAAGTKVFTVVASRYGRPD